MFDEYGNATEHGITNMGLHALNYNTNMEKAIAYANELQEIEQQWINDPHNKNLEDRYKELRSAQQESINAAIEEKNAIKDLYEQGYNKLMESLQDVIDKRKEAMDFSDDLRNYEKTVKEQVKSIASIRKQLLAFSTDYSEETKAKVQELTVSLEKAEEDLQETEHDRWKRDQQAMLDTLANDTQTWINSRLDNIDQLVYEAVERTNGNLNTINTTLNGLSSAYGTEMSNALSLIWNDGGIAKNAVGVYKDVLYGIQLDGQSTGSDVNEILQNAQNILVNSGETNTKLQYVAESIGTNTAQALTSNKEAIDSSTGTLKSAIDGNLTGITNLDTHAQTLLGSIGTVQSEIKGLVSDSKELLQRILDKDYNKTDGDGNTGDVSGASDNTDNNKNIVVEEQTVLKQDKNPPEDPPGLYHVSYFDPTDKQTHATSSGSYSEAKKKLDELSKDGKTDTKITETKKPKGYVVVVNGKEQSKMHSTQAAAEKELENIKKAVPKASLSVRAKYAKGGLLPTSPRYFDKFARSMGEDHIGTIAYKDGERILTPEQNANWEEWTKALPSLVDFSKYITKLDFSSTAQSKPLMNSSSISIGEIIMNEVNNPEQFARQLVDSLNNNNRVKKIIQDNTIGIAMGRNSLSSHRR